MVVRIDGVEVPVVDRSVEFPRYSVNSMRSCQAQREGAEMVLGVEATEATAQLFGFADCAHTSEDFNSSYH